MSDTPLVSCLLVTQFFGQRIPYVKRSIEAFCAQTYPLKELVIVWDMAHTINEDELDEYLVSLGRSDIRLVKPEPKRTLGALRNRSIREAFGQVLCQWDDDDLHHPQRIERQIRYLKECGAEAVGLQEVMQFFPASRELYWTNWRALPASVLPGTIMFHSTAPISYPEVGGSALHGEDTAVCLQLLERKSIVAFTGAPELYIYVSHGANTYSDEHHGMLAKRLGLSSGLLRRRENWIRNSLEAVDFGVGPIAVTGPNGVAFTIER